MSDIKYVQPHRLTLKQAKQAAQKAADDLSAEYDLSSEWDGDTLHFHRSGVEGTMRVTEKAVELDVKLGFLLRPFKATFEEHIERHLAERLSGTKSASRSTRKA
ncbi:MAG TPA: polyhydroxyalkanoic acid system family protein [Burkholderiaceae bacterium]|nr:polyhydroxyalkanoic acid system family protein [Burkholderiaceae bacterium]